MALIISILRDAAAFRMRAYTKDPFPIEPEFVKK